MSPRKDAEDRDLISRLLEPDAAKKIARIEARCDRIETAIEDLKDAVASFKTQLAAIEATREEGVD